MLLNYDLIREILLDLEEKADGYRNYPWIFLYDESPNFQSLSDKTTFRYHIKYLHDAGYIQSDRYLENILDLTPLGRDYLNHVRNQGIWQETKKQISNLGNVTLPIISEIAKTLVLKTLGLG